MFSKIQTFFCFSLIQALAVAGSPATVAANGMPIPVLPQQIASMSSVQSVSASISQMQEALQLAYRGTGDLLQSAKLLCSMDIDVCPPSTRATITGLQALRDAVGLAINGLLGWKQMMQATPGFGIVPQAGQVPPTGVSATAIPTLFAHLNVPTTGVPAPGFPGVAAPISAQTPGIIQQQRPLKDALGLIQPLAHR